MPKKSKKLMDAVITITYRCNAHCQMCNIWKYPTQAEENFNLEKHYQGLMEVYPIAMDRTHIKEGKI